MCSSLHSVLTPVLVLVVLLLVNGVYAQKLFPPVQSTKNFALRQPATTTSTCRTCEVGQAGCAPCNNSCPYNEQQLPEPLNLLEVGTLASGVVRYVFAKTTQNGATTFYALFLDSEEQSATFQYRHEGLEQGFRNRILLGINVADRRFHHIAVSVFGSYLALYIDGQLHSDPHMLVATVEDGPGVVFLGRRVQDRSRFSGLMYSVFYFNSTLSNNNIATLAAVASDLYIQPECQCPPSHSIVLERECQDLSGTNRISRINSAAHDATYINDGNTSTWWQSSNGETPVNVTVGLGGLRAALTVVMHFKSFLPYAMVLYYSSNGELFSPRKFYAVNCSMFSFLSNGSLSTSTDVSCVTFNSSSLRDRYVEFRVLDMGNQTGVGDYFINSDLLEFAQASHVRLELLAWDTDELADQYFAISEVIVYGQACVCNGHATMCNGATCICEQNTTGTHCELCLEGYFNYNPEVCELCRCNTAGTTGGSNVCDSATGQCPCESNFVGLNCSFCASGYYWNGSDANCLPCDNQCLECTGPGPTNCEIEATPTSTLPTPQVESSTTLLLPVPSAMIEPQVSVVLEDMASSISELTLQPPLSLSESNLTQTLSFSKTNLTRATQVPSVASMDAFMNKEVSSTMLSLLIPITSESMDTFVTIISPSPSTTTMEETVPLPLPSSELLLPSETPFLQASELMFDESSLPLPSQSLQVMTTSIISETPAILKQTVSPQPTDITLSPSKPQVMSMLPQVRGPEPSFPFMSTLFSTPNPSITSHSETTPRQTLQPGSSSTLAIEQTNPQPSITTLVLEEASSFIESEIQPTVTTTITHMPVTSSSIVELVTQLSESYSLDSLFPAVTFEIPPKSTVSQLFLEKFSLNTTPSTYLPSPASSVSSFTIEPSFSPPPTTSLPLSLFSYLMTSQPISTSQIEVTPTSTLPTPQVESSTTLLLPVPSAIIEPQVSVMLEDMASSISELTLQPPLSLSESSLTQTLLLNQVTSLLQLSVSISTATARPMTEIILSLLPSSKLLPLSESPSLISSVYESSSTLFQSSLLSTIQPTTHLSLSETPVPTFSFSLPPQLLLTSPSLEPASTSPRAPSSSMVTLNEGLASSNNTFMSSSDQVSLSELIMQNPLPTPVMRTSSVTSVQTEIPPLINQTVNAPFLTQLTAASSNSAVLFDGTSIQLPITPLPVLTTPTFLSESISKSVVQLMSAEVSTLSTSSVDPAIVSTHLTITGMDTSFSQPSSRSDTQLPTSVGIIELTAVLNSSVQVTPSLTRHTSVSAVITSEVPHVSISQLMAVPSTTPVVASPTSVTKTIGPKLITRSPSFTLTATPVPFMCPQSPQVNYMENHLVDIVLGLIVIEHMELAVDRSPRQCRLEQALVEVFDLGLQMPSEGSQGKKKRQLQNGGNYAANITEVGQLSNGQSTITFYIINVTSTVPFIGTTVVQAFLKANRQEVDTYPVIRQASPHTMESSTLSSTIVPIVAGVVGGSVLLVGLLVAAVLLLCLVWWYRKKQEYGLFGVETHRTSDFDEYAIDSIENQHSLVPSHPISTRELLHTDMEHGVSEDEQNIGESRVPATFFERVTHYDTPRSSSLMQPKFRGTVAPLPFTTLENSQDEMYIDSEGDGGSVQRERLRKNIQRLQEERDQQALKARRKATLKHCSGSRRKRTNVDLSTYHKDRLLHSQNRKKFVETVDAPLSSATPTSDLPGSPTYRFTRHHLRNRVDPLATVQLPRSQHVTISQLSTSGRLPRHIAHGVQQELTWMRTGSGVQLLRVHPAQMVGQSSPVPTQLSCSPLFTTHTHVHTQPQDDDSMSSADQPTSPDRQQDPEQGNSVQDLIQQAFSCTTLSTQQVASLSTQSGHPSSHAQCTSPHPQLSPQAEFIIEEKGQVVWIPPNHPALHSSPILGLQGNQNSTNSSL